MLEDRWKDKCDLCGTEEGPFVQENMYPPDITLLWCYTCERDKEKCTRKIIEIVENYRNRIINIIQGG